MLACLLEFHVFVVLLLLNAIFIRFGRSLIRVLFSVFLFRFRCEMLTRFIQFQLSYQIINWLKKMLVTILVRMGLFSGRPSFNWREQMKAHSNVLKTMVYPVSTPRTWFDCPVSFVLCAQSTLNVVASLANIFILSISRLFTHLTCESFLAHWFRWCRLYYTIQFVILFLSLMLSKQIRKHNKKINKISMPTRCVMRNCLNFCCWYVATATLSTLF